MNSIMGVVVVLIVLNILFLVTGKSFFCLFKRDSMILWIVDCNQPQTRFRPQNRSFSFSFYTF